jgi:hypothetical protein
VIELLNIDACSKGEKVSDDRHAELEKAEKQTHFEVMPVPEITHSHARGNRYSKRVHRKPDGNQ